MKILYEYKLKQEESFKDVVDKLIKNWDKWEKEGFTVKAELRNSPKRIVRILEVDDLEVKDSYNK